MRNLIVMFVTAVCFLFLLKLKWPKNKNFYDELFSLSRSIITRLKHFGSTSFSSEIENMYRVSIIETREHVWENEKRFFEFSANFH